MTPITLFDSKWPPRDGQFTSTIILYFDNWNDYGYRTSFVMCFCDETGRVNEIGNVKIYYWQNDEARSNSYYEHTKESLGTCIGTLDSLYCSLGQELSYYKNLKLLLPDEYMNILRRLNDIAVFDELRERFINEKGVQSSLLRFSGAEKALNEAKEIIADSLKLKDISFSYQVIVPYSETPTTLSFDFAKSDEFPYRINALIGKNGTGKTQILSRLANSLSGLTENREYGLFVDGRPPFDKVMSISYSAFDCFKKPPEDDGRRSVFSYVYCGIQSEHGTLSLTQLRDNLRKAYGSVKSKHREPIWQSVLSVLMEQEHRETVKMIGEERFDDVNLSSGQQILICTVTELVANIENESIILFDEPELHLHPNAIANIIRMFYRLLDTFNSYAIFTTHSPLFLQEIPSRYIQILDRIDNILTVRKPEIECFGNNISEIIFDIFDVSSTESNYKTHLRNLSKSHTYDDILKMFGGKLGINALIYLKSCYDKGDQYGSVEPSRNR